MKIFIRTIAVICLCCLGRTSCIDQGTVTSVGQTVAAVAETLAGICLDSYRLQDPKDVYSAKKAAIARILWSVLHGVHKGIEPAQMTDVISKIAHGNHALWTGVHGVSELKTLSSIKDDVIPKNILEKYYKFSQKDEEEMSAWTLSDKVKISSRLVTLVLSILSAWKGQNMGVVGRKATVLGQDVCNLITSLLSNRTGYQSVFGTLAMGSSSIPLLYDGGKMIYNVTRKNSNHHSNENNNFGSGDSDSGGNGGSDSGDFKGPQDKNGGGDDKFDYYWWVRHPEAKEQFKEHLAPYEKLTDSLKKVKNDDFPREDWIKNPNMKEHKNSSVKEKENLNKKQTEEKEAKKECPVCSEELGNANCEKLPCGHEMCKECKKNMKNNYVKFKQEDDEIIAKFAREVQQADTEEKLEKLFKDEPRLKEAHDACGRKNLLLCPLCRASFE